MSPDNGGTILVEIPTAKDPQDAASLLAAAVANHRAVYASLVIYINLLPSRPAVGMSVAAVEGEQEGIDGSGTRTRFAIAALESGRQRALLTFMMSSRRDFLWLVKHVLESVTFADAASAPRNAGAGMKRAQANFVHLDVPADWRSPDTLSFLHRDSDRVTFRVTIGEPVVPEGALDLSKETPGRVHVLSRTIEPANKSNPGVRGWDGEWLVECGAPPALARYSGRATDVIVLTHSQGGLVLRGGLVADGSLEAKIRGVVHTVQPSNGSVTCYRRFLTGAAKPLDTDKTVTDMVLNNIMGTSFAEYAYNLSGLPGTLQLLPNHVYAKFVPGNWLEGVGSSVDLGDIYNVYRRESLPGIAGIVSTAQTQCGTTDEISSGSVASDFANNLAEAERFHKAVETRAHSRTYVLYSTGRSTDQSIAFLDMSSIQFGSISALDYSEDVVDPMTGTVVGVARPQWTFDGTDVKDERSQIVYRKPPEGDGTVSQSSATCPGLAVLAPTPMPAGAALQHSDVFANAAFNRMVEHYVRRLLTPVCG